MTAPLPWGPERVIAPTCRLMREPGGDPRSLAMHPLHTGSI